MQAFEVYIPTQLLFGDTQDEKFAKALTHQAKKIFIVIGGGSVERLGYLNRVVRLLENQGAQTKIFRGIEPNPHAATIDKAAEEVSTWGADALLALGGGSVMDATKAIGALAKSGEKNIWPFVLGNPRNGELKDSLPIATIPTTAATASEVTPFAVISNPDVNGKSPIGHNSFKPFLSWLNPAFTTGLNDTVTRDGASDILSHVFENYIIGGDNAPLADMHCEAIIKTVCDTLPRVINDPINTDLRGRLQWASTMALCGIQQAGRNPGIFIMHAMEHGLSGFYPDLAHGRGLATLYPAYFRWMIQKERAVNRFARLGEQIYDIHMEDQSQQALHFVARFEEWLRENNLLQSLPDLGITEDVYQDIADHTIAVYGKGRPLNALGDVTASDIVSIFRATEHQSVAKTQS